MNFDTTTIINCGRFIGTARTIFSRAKYGDEVDHHELADRIMRHSNYTLESMRRTHALLTENGIKKGDIVRFTPQSATSLCISLYGREKKSVDSAKLVRCANAIVCHLPKETGDVVKQLSPLTKFIEVLTSACTMDVDEDILHRLIALKDDAADRLKESTSTVYHQLLSL